MIRCLYRYMAASVVGLLVASPGVGTCEVMINELMADPATDWDGDGDYSYRSDEWVEVVNAGDSDVDLGQYFLGDESGSAVYGFSGPLAPGAVVVVFGSESVAWEQENGESATGLRLSNDGDSVTLWRVVAGDTTLVDAYEYNTYEAEDDRSTGRRPDGGATWEIFDSLNPYSGEGPPAGNGLPPSPGTENGQESSPTESLTWGRVKRLFEGNPPDPIHPR